MRKTPAVNPVTPTAEHTFIFFRRLGRLLWLVSDFGFSVGNLH
jgi:hypothetical protein